MITELHDLVIAASFCLQAAVNIRINVLVLYNVVSDSLIRFYYVSCLSRRTRVINDLNF